jgi:hypothetical protein
MAMFEYLKKLLSSPAGNRPRSLPAPRSDEADEPGPVISVNLDRMDEGDQKEFRQAVSKKSGLAFFEGRVEYGYSLDYVANKERCPRCQAPTEQRYANFIYITQVAPRVLLAPAGYFCTKCPTVIVNEEILRAGVTRGFQYRGVAGLDYEGKKSPDFLGTWNGEQRAFIFDEDETLVGITTRGGAMEYYDSAPAAFSRKQAEKARKKRQMAKQSRKRNRRK